MVQQNQITEDAAVPGVEMPHEVPADWEPRIIAFACHFCAFSAADLAGVMRLSYSPNIRIIRLPCSGKIDHFTVLRAFERGIDGVFVAG